MTFDQLLTGRTREYNLRSFVAGTTVDSSSKKGTADRCEGTCNLTQGFKSPTRRPSMTGLIERIPAPIRSLWKAETELRRGLWASILNRKEPNPHYAAARRYFDEALSSGKASKQAKWGSAEHVAATVEQDEIDEATKKNDGPTNTPRF
jgi:hypothetical protein